MEGERTSTGVYGDDTLTDLTPDSKKLPRNRIRFSCTTCRDKKLKCNREMPCDQCLKRSLAASCEYVPYLFPKSTARSQRPRAVTTEATLQSKLRHLERLVHVLKSQQRDDGEAAVEVGSSPSLSSAAQSFDGMERGDLDSLDNAMLGATESRPTPTNIDDTPGWEAMLDQISELTNDLRVVTELPTEMESDRAPVPARGGPIALLESVPTATTDELLASIPPRSMVDRQVSKFFQDQPAWMILHLPTFKRDYEEFWNNPSEASVIFIGLIHAIISQSALLSHNTGERMPGNMGEPAEIKETHLTYVAQCLSLGDYTTPGGKYKLETLLIYFGIEFIGRTDATVSTSLLFALVIRLAMHMGYHRDSKNRKDISVFEGEMRRRFWMIVVDVDSQIAFQFGVPTLIAPGTHDVEAPRNLDDEDFDEMSSVLPPSRPLSEKTRVLYMLLKSKIVVCWIEIQQSIYSTQPFAYDRVLELDKRLRSSYESLPPLMRMRDFSQSIGDPVDMVVHRYDRELLYQKCRSVLHRRYLGMARSDSRFAYSQWTCLDAAATTIRHQYDIYVESQPGGLIAKDGYLLHSLTMHNFLLAAMILCLELSNLLHSQSAGTPQDSAHQGFSKDELLDILRTSRRIWETQCKTSSQAYRAFRTISRMLTVATGMEFESSPASSGGSEGGVELQQPSVFQYPQSTGSHLGAFHAMRGSQPVPDYSPSGGDGSSGWVPSLPNAVAPGSWTPQPAIQGSLESIDLGTIDWTNWDSQIQASGSEMPQIAWNSFFQQQQQHHP